MDLQEPPNTWAKAWLKSDHASPPAKGGERQGNLRQWRAVRALIFKELLPLFEAEAALNFLLQCTIFGV
jgi:hypothetical protein